MKTIVWEPMTDKVYGEFDTCADAMDKYNITTHDHFEVRDGVLYIALNDD